MCVLFCFRDFQFKFAYLDPGEPSQVGHIMLTCLQQKKIGAYLMIFDDNSKIIFVKSA